MSATNQYRVATTDTPVSGGWNGDGKDEVEVFRPSTRRFYLDMNGGLCWDVGDVASGPFGLSTDAPLAGKWR